MAKEHLKEGLVLVTGSGQGPSIGAGAAVGVLRKTGQDVIATGRSSFEDTPYADLPGEQQDRVHYVESDLSNENGINELIQVVGRIREDTGKKLTSVIASLGTGYLDKDFEGEEGKVLRRMQRFLNVVGPTHIALRLNEEGLMDRDTLFIYISALFTSETLQQLLTGVVDEFTRDKLDAFAMLKQYFEDNGSGYLVKAVMGDVLGKMMDKYMNGSETGGLVEYAEPAWFLGLPADPFQPGSVGDQLGALTTKEPALLTKPQLIPNLSKLVSTVPAGVLRKLLPMLLQSGAPAVAEYYGVSKDDYDRCLEYHIKRRTHPNMNLEAARSTKWWPLWASRLNVQAADRVLNR